MARCLYCGTEYEVGYEETCDVCASRIVSYNDKVNTYDSHIRSIDDLLEDKFRNKNI